jgi:hypothetical protein
MLPHTSTGIEAGTAADVVKRLFKGQKNILACSADEIVKLVVSIQSSGLRYGTSIDIDSCFDAEITVAWYPLNDCISAGTTDVLIHGNQPTNADPWWYNELVILKSTLKQHRANRNILNADIAGVV